MISTDACCNHECIVHPILPDFYLIYNKLWYLLWYVILLSYNFSAKQPLEQDPKIIRFHKMLLIKTLVKACGWPLLLAQLLRLMGIVLDFMNPQLLRWD